MLPEKYPRKTSSSSATMIEPRIPARIQRRSSSDCAVSFLTRDGLTAVLNYWAFRNIQCVVMRLFAGSTIAETRCSAEGMHVNS